MAAEARWRRYFGGCGFPPKEPRQTFAAQSAVHVLVALEAARGAQRHVRGLDGRALLRDLISSRGARFWERLRAVLGGHHLAEAGLEHVLEPDLYDWVGRLGSGEVEQALREAATLALGEPGNADLAERYLELSPQSFRRALGEHYTPAWLVDLVLERTRYDPTRDTLLDPTCGAGAFLSGALARIRIDQVAEIVRRVRGLELNPLAVSLSRLAYLDGLGPDRCVELAARGLRVPVLLGDALFGPRAVGGPPDSPRGEWRDAEPVSLLAGNPPWVCWERLSVAYREGLRDQRSELCEALFPHRGLRARSGGAHDDLSGLVTYGAADRFLAPGGRLGFVLPVSLFRSRRGGEGFRGLRLGDRFSLQVRSVDDLTALRPFPGAAGRAAVLVATRRATSRREATRYPVGWTRWSASGRRPGVREELRVVRRRAHTEELCAEPVTRTEPSSPWLVASRAELPALRRMAGPSPYRARKGVDTSLNAVFWVEVLERQPGSGEGLWRVRNAQTRSRSPVAPTEALLEPDALYPLLRGRDFARWTATPRYHQVLLYDPATGRPLPEVTAQQQYPRAHAYLDGYAESLVRRGIYRKHLQDAPPYACYDIGPYSFAPTKVVWKALADGIQACVVHSADARPIVPDHNVVLVALDDPDEAHFLCGVLNSTQVTRFANAYTGWFYSTHLLQTLAVPQYNPGSEIHRHIVALSRAAHVELVGEPAEHQTRLDHLVGSLDGFFATAHKDLP